MRCETTRKINNENKKKIYINNENKTNSNVHRDSHALSELFMAERQIHRERERDTSTRDAKHFIVRVIYGT